MFQYSRKGIKINSTNLWLDAGRVVDCSCVSHSHMDHAKKHKQIIATEETIRFFKKRVGNTNAIQLKYGEPLEIEGCTVTLFPAGHILGSAQMLVEMDGMRLLYSGDFNIGRSLTAEPIEIPESDLLIMECTFGRPFYRFPARKLVEEQLLHFVDRSFKAGATPVVIGYALGKAQEAMKIFGDAGVEMSVHATVATLARVYEDLGIQLGSWSEYKKDELDGRVLIVPPAARKTRIIERIPNKRTVFLSGWAINSRTKYRWRVDEALPLSDHADFDGLIEYAKRVNPKKIYTTHGFKDFPQYLRDLGFDAEPLRAERQLSLF